MFHKTMCALLAAGFFIWLGTSAVKAQSPFSKINRVALNPQPLPPRPGDPVKRFLPGSRVMLNPQPLPPRIARVLPGSQLMLNPQPLPPRITGTISRFNMRR